MKRTLLFFLIVFSLSINTAISQDTFSGYPVTREGAWCWFADPRALHHENQEANINCTYIGYIDIHGAIKATQYNHLTNTVDEVLIRSYFQPDDHDNPTFLVLPDNRIMIFYSRHTDESCFYYRISRKAGDITTLGAEKKIVTSHNTTYPSPFILSDDPNNIYLCWRGINWHPTVAKISIPDANDNVSFNWGPYQIVQSTGARPYAKYASNGKDKIYLTYTTGHPDNEVTNYVYFNYIDVNDLKLKDVKGTVLSTIAGGVHQVAPTSAYSAANPNAVVENTNYRNWVWETAMNESGQPVIAMVRINGDKTSHDYYHVQWNGSAWKKTFLANGGGHFHQTPGLELCYSGGMAIDKKNPNQMYCSVPVNGSNGRVYEIVKYTVNDNGSVSNEAITSNSVKNNIRPYYILQSENSSLKLVWMNGDYYDWIVSSSRPKAYPTGINADFQLPVKEINLEKDLIKKEDFNASIDGFTTENGKLKSTKSTSFEFLKGNNSGQFTLSLSPAVSETTYDGEIFSTGTFSYGLSASTMKPYVKIENRTYSSTNILGNSDVWKTTSRGTGGQWYTPTKMNFFSLSLTYENGILRTYINGLLDQSIEIQDLILGDIKLGGFEGWIEDCMLYSRVLSIDELRNIVQNLSASLEFSELLSIRIPSTIYSDIVLKSATSSGNTIQWTSSNTNIVSISGIVTLPLSPTNIQLTATSGTFKKTFDVTVMPRDISKNKLFFYDFGSSDEYTSGETRYVIDKSGNGHNATVYGNARVNGKLDLTANTDAGFSTNGYAKASDGILDSLRSYSFVMKVMQQRTNKQPRLYDFGSDAGNSVFGRASALTVGLKYQGGTTAMINSSQNLTTGKESILAFTFDAKSKTSKIYLDGTETATGTTISNEPYMLTGNNRNYIGRTQWWDQSVAADNVDFCGTIDDFYLFNIALTKEEIKQLYTTSGLNEVENTSVFQLYPNPTGRNEDIYLTFDLETNIHILSGNGQTVQKYCFDSGTITTPSESGLYFIKATNNQGVSQIRKLIVK